MDIGSHQKSSWCYTAMFILGIGCGLDLFKERNLGGKISKPLGTMTTKRKTTKLDHISFDLSTVSLPSSQGVQSSYNCSSDGKRRRAPENVEISAKGKSIFPLVAEQESEPWWCRRPQKWTCTIDDTLARRLFWILFPRFLFDSFSHQSKKTQSLIAIGRFHQLCI